MKRATAGFFFTVVLLDLARSASAVSIDTNPIGAVDGFLIRMGTYEITNSQYVDFLNANRNAPDLYNVNMTTDDRGGIIRNGAPGSYTYSVKPNMGNKPVNFVNAYDAMRMANWLHKGQLVNKDLQVGSYNLNVNSGTGRINDLSRLPGATWVVPTLTEWNVAAQGSIVNTKAVADAVGNVSNPGVGVTNYDLNADWNLVDGHLTTVGSTKNPTQWGMQDIYGNVEEWVVEGPSPVAGGYALANVGGGFGYPYDNLFQTTTTTFSYNPDRSEYTSLGIRLAYIVPEPNSLALAGVAVTGLIGFWTRKQRGSHSGTLTSSPPAYVDNC